MSSANKQFRVAVSGGDDDGNSSKRHRDELSQDVPQCSICLSELNQTSKQITALECGHAYHVECIDQWLCINPSCPLCKGPVHGRLSSSRPDVNLVDMLLDDFTRHVPDIVTVARSPAIVLSGPSAPPGASQRPPAAATVRPDSSPFARLPQASSAMQRTSKSSGPPRSSHQSKPSSKKAPPASNLPRSAAPSRSSGQSQRSSGLLVQHHQRPQPTIHADHGYTFDMNGVIIRGPSGGISPSDEIKSHTVNIGLQGTSVSRVYGSGSIESITIPLSHYPVKVSDDHKIFVGSTHELLETTFQLPGFTKIKVNLPNHSVDNGVEPEQNRATRPRKHKQERSDADTFHVPNTVASVTAPAQWHLPVPSTIPQTSLPIPHSTSQNVILSSVVPTGIVPMLATPAPPTPALPTPASLTQVPPTPAPPTPAPPTPAPPIVHDETANAPVLQVVPVIQLQKICYHLIRRGPREGQMCGVAVKNGSLRCCQHDKKQQKE